MKKEKETLQDEIADKVRADLRDLANQGFLPPLTELAKRYGVSRPTMSRVLQGLDRKGLIRMHRGRRIRLAGEAVEREHRDTQRVTTLPSSERLYWELRSGIGNGTYELGKPLPSVKYLVLTYHVSNHTVLKVYNRLIDEDLAHRKGKSVIAGSGKTVRVSPTGRRLPVILVIERKHGAWKQLCMRQRDGEFGRRVVQETERTGARLVPVVVGEESSRESEVFDVADGADALPRIVDSYGSNYWGALVIDKPEDLPGFSQVLDHLTRRSHPVVWFDSYDRGFPQTVSFRKNLIRCKFDERKAVECALDHLEHWGHKRCLWATVSWQGTLDWQNNRERLVHEEASRRKEPITVYSWTTPTVEEWKDFTNSRLPPHLSRIHQEGPSIAVKALDWFVAHNQELKRKWRRYLEPSWHDSEYAGFIAVTIACYAGDPEVGEGLHKEQLKIISALALNAASFGKPPPTSFICPSDAFATRVCLRWLRYLEMKVPQDMSVISFDNYLKYEFHPIDSIDFGFGRLGYLAFHAILGDIPIRRTRSGEIEAIPHVVGRGSVRMGTNLQQTV